MESLSLFKNPVMSIINDTTSNSINDSSINEDTYGKCGILTACLTDPLSKLVSKIYGLSPDEVNSVGVYYEAELHGTIKCNVLLFNIYDNDPIPWLRLGYSMDLLISSPFVNKILFYPLTSLYQNNSVLSRSNISSKQTYNKLEERFRTAVVQILSYNSKITRDKNINYTALLLKGLGVTGRQYDNIINSTVTGYTLVNKALLMLMGVNKVNPGKISSSIIHCPLFRTPICITSFQEKNKDLDVQYIIEECRREITTLAAVFVDLYTSNKDFRNSIITTGFKKTIVDDDISELLSRELEFAAYVTGGIQNGVLSTISINEIIEDINKERSKLGSNDNLPLLLSYQSNVKVTDKLLMCSFNTDNEAANGGGMKNLGAYIQHIADSFQNDEVLNINIGTLISAYNNAIKGSKLTKVKLPDKMEAATLSKTAVVTIPGNDDSVDLSMNDKHIAIPMYGANLTVLTQGQLMDILLYLDSLKSNDGEDNNKYANLQNDITYELARRNNKTSNK